MTIVITGANKGIGFQIARQFAQNNYSRDIIITSRNTDLGKEATAKLTTEFKNADTPCSFIYHQLDITDFKSRSTFIDFLKKKYNKIEILINNAGIAYKCNSTADFGEQADVTNTTNYFGTKSLTVEMLDEGLFNPANSKVLTCGSLCSDTSFAKCSPAAQQGFKENIKSIPELDSVVEDFIDLAEKDEHQSMYSNSAYGMSKVFVRCLSCILATAHPNIKFYTYCPGWCKTDMAGWDKAPLTAEEGSRIAYWLAMTQDKVVVEMEATLGMAINCASGGMLTGKIN